MCIYLLTFCDGDPVISAKDKAVDMESLHSKSHGRQRGTTFMVPQSDNIHISFSSTETQPSDGTTIHMDLLTLYRDVLREVIHMDKVKQVVRGVVEQMNGYDNLRSRVEKLEDKASGDGITKADEATSSRQEYDSDNEQKLDTNEWLDDLTFEDKSHIYSEQTLTNPYGNFVVQDNSHMIPSGIQEEIARLAQKQTAQQRQITDLEYSLQQERLNTQTLTSSLRLQTTEYEEARRILIRQATLLEEQTLKLDVQQSALNIQDAKLNQLVLQLQWKTGQVLSLGDGSSKPQNLTEELITLQTRMGNFDQQVKQINIQLDNTVEKVNENEVELRWLKIKIHNIRENMKKLLLLLTGYPDGTAMQPLLSLNQTKVKSILLSVETTRSADDVDDSSTVLFSIVKQLNVTQRMLVNGKDHQQRQMNTLQIDVTTLKEEMNDSWNQLQSLEAEFTSIRGVNSEWLREKETMKRRLNRMMRDIRELYDTIENTNDNKHEDNKTPSKNDYGDNVLTQVGKHGSSGGPPQPMTEALIGDPSVTEIALVPSQPHTPQVSVPATPVQRPSSGRNNPHQGGMGSSMNNAATSDSTCMYTLLLFVCTSVVVL